MDDEHKRAGGKGRDLMARYALGLVLDKQINIDGLLSNGKARG
jgi:hypothetical protein